MNIRAVVHTGAIALAMLGLTACGGGGGGGGDPAAEGTNFDSGCTGSCATNNPANLTVADVQQVIAQAVLEANTRGVLATIAVTDRVGNVLGIFQMTTADRTINIQTGTVNTLQGLENINDAVPSDLAAIAKAVTGAYLASEGNAFSTRVASQIIQQHFNPHEFRAPGGPLFGVQFSQLPCSDMVQQGAGIGIGPQRSPLGLSADPGGFPLYKNGHPVGGVGVITDGLYSLDRNLLNTDNDIDELVALAGTFGYAAPTDRLANRITVDGRSLRYSDVDFDDLISNPASASFAAVNGALGTLIDDNGVNLAVPSNPTPNIQNYFIAAGGVLAGSTFGATSSGIIPAGSATDANTATDYSGLDAFVLTDNGAGGAGTLNRYPATAGSSLTRPEVVQLVRSALDVANRARGQIRRPLGSQARVTISIVDTDGTILAIARTRDAPMFGTDVSLQKARTATFFSSADAGTVLNALPDADVSAALATLTYNSPIGDYVGSVAGSNGVRAFLGTDTALTGTHAFADRSGGNLSRPFYPDGIDGNTNGPFSKPFVVTGHTNDGASTDVVDAANNEWSPFNNGLQLDLVYNNLIEHLTGANETDCTGGLGAGGGLGTRLANGIQIFPGSVPIYKNGALAGGIGVSGDGIEQDDMISFLGTYNASLALGGDGIGDSASEIGNAPTAIRADNITPPTFPGQSLRYIQCPNNPFLNSNQQNVCDGK